MAPLFIIRQIALESAQGAGFQAGGGQLVHAGKIFFPHGLTKFIPGPHCPVIFRPFLFCQQADLILHALERALMIAQGGSRPA